MTPMPCLVHESARDKLGYLVIQVQPIFSFKDLDPGTRYNEWLEKVKLKTQNASSTNLDVSQSALCHSI